jgi:hypothetical protein
MLATSYRASFDRRGNGCTSRLIRPCATSRFCRRASCSRGSSGRVQSGPLARSSPTNTEGFGRSSRRWTPARARTPSGRRCSTPRIDTLLVRRSSCSGRELTGGGAERSRASRLPSRIFRGGHRTQRSRGSSRPRRRLSRQSSRSTRPGCGRSVDLARTGSSRHAPQWGFCKPRWPHWRTLARLAPKLKLPKTLPQPFDCSIDSLPLYRRPRPGQGAHRRSRSTLRGGECEPEPGQPRGAWNRRSIVDARIGIRSFTRWD